MPRFSKDAELLSRIDRIGHHAVRVLKDVGERPSTTASDEDHYAWLMRCIERANELKRNQ